MWVDSDDLDANEDEEPAPDPQRLWDIALRQVEAQLWACCWHWDNWLILLPLPMAGWSWKSPLLPLADQRHIHGHVVQCRIERNWLLSEADFLVRHVLD